MADDDLLLTNKYAETYSNESSNNEIFTKLMQAKKTSKEVYEKDPPQFTDDVETRQNIGASISENSVAFEQFLKFAQTDKKKKIKKTIMNIDSRNRTKTYTFDSLSIKYSGDTPIHFINNSSFFEITIDSNTNTNNVNYIDDVKFFNQVILTNLSEAEFSKLGITKDNFEFSVTSGEPIFDIIKFIYETFDQNGDLISSETDSFDNSKQKFRYNKLLLNMPSNIEPSEIQTIRIGKDSELNIITNVNISYPTPSHYFINLGKTFSNVYSVKLISSEIPNTSYTFNENLIETNFGQFKLSTKQNNKLRWINKTDRVSVATNGVNMGSLFYENMPILPSVNAEQLHNEHFEKISNQYNCNLNSIKIKAISTNNITNISSLSTLDQTDINTNDFFILRNQTELSENGIYKRLDNLGAQKVDMADTSTYVSRQGLNYIYFICNGSVNKGKYFIISKISDIINFISIDYLENLKRLCSLVRVSQDTVSNNSNIPLVKRDYYFNNSYIGELVIDNNSIIGISQNASTNISNTVFTYNECMISKTSKDLNSYYFYEGIVNLNSYTNNNTYTVFNFASFTSLNIDIYKSSDSNSVFDYIESQITSIDTPFKIIFKNKYIGSTQVTYIFHVTQISKITNNLPDGRHVKRWQLDLIPIDSNVSNQLSIESKPFANISDNSEIMLTVFNPIKPNILFNYQKYYPDLWGTLQNYYIKSEQGLKLSDSLISNHTIQLGYSAIDSTKDSPTDDGSTKNLRYLLEFKTYHSYTFTNSVLTKQVEVKQVPPVVGGYYLFIFFQDANADSVSEISNIAKQYTYARVNNNFYRLGSDITYNVTTRKFKIQIIPVEQEAGSNNDGVEAISDTDTTINIKFQKLDNKELEFIYIKTIDEHIDLSNKVIRINEESKYNFDFNEYFFAGKIESNKVEVTGGTNFYVQKYEVRYKFKSPFSKIDLLSSSKKHLISYDECNKIYMRDFIGNYIVTNLSNKNTDSNGDLLTNITCAYMVNNSQVVYVTKNDVKHFLEHYESNITKKMLEIDIVDIPSYLIIGISNKNIQDGISNISFAKEFIETEDKSSFLMNPKVNDDTNKLPSYLNMNTNSKAYKAVDNKLATKYPVYELNIASGKYSADSIVKYMLGALDNLKSRMYDYSKGIFFNDSSFQKFIDLNNEFGINQESKFVISVDKSVNSISFKQYKKIFDSHRNTSVIKGQIAYYNEGFPFVYFNIPQISLPNNSLVYMSGGGKLGNMGGGVTRGERNVIVPLNFRIRIRQLLPLPKIDSINNKANLFAKEGYVDVEDNQIYNKFVDYINNAVNSNNVKDISTDYIVKEIFGYNESGYIDLENLSEDKLNTLKEQFNSNNIPKNSANITESDLTKSFVDNYGKNTKYKRVSNFNNQNENTFSYNRTGLEYFGQALINGYNNEQPYQEYFANDKEPEDNETYGDERNSGFQTTFIQNELFMRLSDTNVTNRKNMIARFTKVSENSDKYGNIEADYDLFSDNYLNFKIGDIIIGLDSNTIGIILPYDYKYNALPNNDLVALGAGAYLMNKSVFDSGAAFEKYVSVTNSKKNTRDLAKKFVSNINNWQIERNKTNRGFYTFSSTTPNSSKLSGTKLPNFQLYVPRFFKFLEDDDTALDKFGLKNSETNNKFNYFKTNYEANHEVTIKRSFFNIAKNNEIFTDYLIFETKSTDNFSVNDRVYIEDHSVVLKGGDFKREKFFNVELLENYASFISKLESIYNNTVQNYNGLSGIGDTFSNDSTFLYDKEYKYEDAPSNSVARGTANLEAQITNFVIENVGLGYTGEPSITIESLFQINDNNAETTSTIRDGALLTVGVTNGGKYTSIPNVTVESPNITANVAPRFTPLNAINTVEVPANQNGFGYTQAPSVTAPASDGITATISVIISGIGVVNLINSDLSKWIDSAESGAQSIKTKINPSANSTGRIDILFSAPSASTETTDRASGFISWETDSNTNMTAKSITITKSGSKYSPTETINITRVSNWDTLQTLVVEDNPIINDNLFTVIVNAIGELTVGAQGTKYYTNGANSNQTGNTFLVYNNVVNYTKVITKGSPELTISDTVGSGSGAIIQPILTDGNLTGLDIVYGGQGYSTSTTITVDSPKALFKSEINSDGRLQSVSVVYSPIGYPSTTTLTVEAPKETALGSIDSQGAVILSNRGKGYVSTVQGEPAVISGYGGTTTSIISDGKIQSLELTLNTYSFAPGESPLIIIFKPGSNDTVFRTLTIFKAARGHIEMKRAYSTPSDLSVTSHALVNKNSVTSDYDIELAGSSFAGPATNIYNSIFRVIINSDHSDWNDYKFTSAPDVCVYKIRNNTTEYVRPTGDSTYRIEAAADIDTNNNVISENKAVSVKAIIEKGTILSTTVNTGSVNSSQALVYNSPFIQSELSSEIESKITSISIDNNGKGYDTVSPQVTIDSPKITGKASAIVNSDGTISRIEVIDIGAGYRTDNLPSITIAIPPDNTGTQAKASVLIKNGHITEITITNSGSKYEPNVPPSVTIDAPNSGSTTIIQATASSTVINGKVTDFTINNQGSGYRNVPKVSISNPGTIAKIPIPFKNREIYRFFNQDITKYNLNYYLTYKASSPKFGEFTLTQTNSEIDLLKIENDFDFIVSKLNVGDIRNNLCVIKISNDTNNSITFTRSNNNNNNKFVTTSTNNSFCNVDEKYHINIKTYRVPIAVNKTENFGNISSDGSHKTQYISEYSTMGIFQRLLDEQINNIYNNMNYNIIKAAELYRTYSFNIYKNRIIKLKVCPIDEQGFSFENCNENGSVATETLLSNRQIKGYSKKLFPYHEYDIIKSYDKSEFGRGVDIIGTSYKSYRRPQQHFDNKETTSKSFLPGMGVYIVKDEKINNGTKINNTHYNSTSSAKNITLFYSEYTYDTQFIGYVVGTSINSRQEYDRNYRLHSDYFSKTDNSNSIHSEYYVYMLIDPDVTSTAQIDQLFDLLNKDNVNIVFDANAKEDYTTNPLTRPGYVTSKNEFYINNNVNTHKTKSDDKQYSIPKNIHKQRCFMNEQNVLKFFEDETYEDEIDPSNIDGFLGLTASSLTISKPKLNKTLPYYSFQTRMACATIVERPVAYERKNDTNSRKLFNAADYDYFYKHYMENKTVMRYKSLHETKNVDNMNKHNMIIENSVNKNFKSNNFKETDCHSSSLDPNINNTEDYFDIGNISNIHDSTKGNNQVLKFNNGEDIILVDAYKRKFSYESGDVDYTDVQGRGENKLGIQHTHIKILTASIIPPLFFNHNRLYDNKLNEYCNHASVLDHNFDSGIERLTYCNILGKYKPDRIHIVGNNSNEYNGNDEKDMNIYNKIFVNNIGTNNIYIDTTIGTDIQITSGNVNKLLDCILVVSTNIKCKNETQPIDNTNNTEISIINNAELIGDQVKLTLKNNLVNNHASNTNNINGRSFIPYATVKTSSELIKDGNYFKFDIDNTNSQYSILEKGDYLLFDWGIQREVINVGSIPFKIKNNQNDQANLQYTTAVYKIADKEENNTNTIKTISIVNPKVFYPSGTRVIILKNPFKTTQKSTISNNFMSTQPFTINNEWYTRIFYKGASYNIGSHFDSSYNQNNILPNLENRFVSGGTPLFNKNYSNSIFIGGMKGLKLPFINLDSSNTISDVYSVPVEDDFYDMIPALTDDYMCEDNSSPIINNIKGEFTTRFNNINNISDFDNNPDINTINEAQWIDTPDKEVEFASLVIKGFYLGYGGFIEDRANQDTINTIINKSGGTAIKKIKKINNKFYIYVQLSSTYNNFFLSSNLDESYNLFNQSTRKTYLDYETNLQLLDEILETQPEEYEPYLSIFGKNGKMVRKIIKTPYDLNPNNYIYMVIPNLNHIKSVQNNEIEGAFAKVLLPGDSNQTLFSSFVAGTKIFYNNLFNNLNELEITFITNEGHLFDFNGSEHSFSIEITEIIDKLEYINPRFGNIEF